MGILDTIKDPSTFNIVFLNPLTENFRLCFSKLETITALEYVLSNHEKFHIYPVVKDWTSGNDFQKVKVARTKNSEHESRGMEFVEKFQDLSKLLPVAVTQNFNEDPQDFLIDKKKSSNMIFIGGFNTEFDVMMYAAQLFLKGYLPVVISDLCSSTSERAHFSSLEALSRFAEIIDTRDFQRADNFGK